MNNLVKVSEASGKVLDYLVATAEGWTFSFRDEIDYLVAKAEGWTFNGWHQSDGDWQVWAEKVDDEGRGPAGYFPTDSRLHFSTDWAQGGPIIEREQIRLDFDVEALVWLADANQSISPWKGAGPTPLIAAMRCFVASKLGNEVVVPKELL